MCNLLCGGKTRVCRKQGGSQVLRSQSLSSIKYCTLKYPLTSSPRNFVSWVWFCQTHRLTASGSTDVKRSFMMMKKTFCFEIRNMCANIDLHQCRRSSHQRLWLSRRTYLLTKLRDWSVYLGYISSFSI